MSATEIIQVVRDLGVPVVFCFYLLHKVIKQQDKQSEALAKILVYMKVYSRSLDLSEEEKKKLLSSDHGD